MSERKYELARYIHISANPETLSKDQLVDELFDVANYASQRVSECHALRNIIRSAMKKGLTDD